MGLSSDLDSEGLLKKSSYETDETLYTWAEAPRGWRKSFRQNTCSFVLLPVLVLSNIITLRAVISLLASRQPSTPPVNHPPTGVAPTLAHLIQKPEPRFWNYSFYDDGSWLRKHDSVEADQAWYDYTQVGKLA